MGIRSTHTTRNLNSRKASVPTIEKGKPLDARGNEGDLTFRRSSEGLKLYIKANHKWHGIKVGESFDSLEKKINEIKSKVDTIKQFRLPSTYSVTGDFTLDVSGDIELNADGGQITIKDDTASHFLFDCDATSFTIYDDTDVSDYFVIGVAANGETTLQTVDAGAAVGHLNVKPDGNINLLSGSGDGLINISKQDDIYATFNVHHGVSDLKLFENGGASQNDYLSIQVGAHGATELITEDGAAAAANFKVTADGLILLNAVNKTQFMNAGTLFGEVKVDTTSQFVLYEQGGATSDDSFIISTATHGATTFTTVDAAAAAANLTMTIDGGITLDSAGEIVIDHTDRFKFKKAGTEYIKFDVDGTSQFTMFEQGGATTHDFFKIACATSGATTIQTVDAASGLGEGTAADLTFDIDGNITHESNGTVNNGSHIFKGAAYQWATISGGSTTSSLTLSNPADTGDYFKILTGASGATIISSIDNQIGAFAAHLTLDPLGEINLTPVTEVKSDAPLKIKEAAAAVADTAAYGQLWTKNETPCELYFTTDAGDDIQLTSGTSAASSSEFRVLLNSGFNYSFTAGTKVYIPLNGYIVETTSTVSTEFNTFVAPYDGYLNQVIFRSEEACGSTVVGFHKSSTNTEFPNPTAAASVTVDMTADDTPFKFAFSSSNTFSAGDVITISFDPTNDANDTIFVVELILDSSSGL